MRRPTERRSWDMTICQSNSWPFRRTKDLLPCRVPYAPKRNNRTHWHRRQRAQSACGSHLTGFLRRVPRQLQDNHCARPVIAPWWQKFLASRPSASSPHTAGLGFSTAQTRHQSGEWSPLQISGAVPGEGLAVPSMLGCASVGGNAMPWRHFTISGQFIGMTCNVSRIVLWI